MDAKKRIWQAACNECGLTDQQTFEGFQMAGWICTRNEAKEKSEWYCPGCVYGLQKTDVPTTPAVPGHEQ